MPLCALLEICSVAAEQFSDRRKWCLNEIALINLLQIDDEAGIVVCLTNFLTGSIEVRSKDVQICRSNIGNQGYIREPVKQPISCLLHKLEERPGQNAKDLGTVAMTWERRDSEYILQPGCLEASISNALLFHPGRYILSTESFSAQQSSNSHSRLSLLTANKSCTNVSNTMTMSGLKLKLLQEFRQKTEEGQTYELSWHPIKLHLQSADASTKLKWLLLSTQPTALAEALLR